MNSTGHIPFSLVIIAPTNNSSGLYAIQNEQYPTLKISQWVSKPELISWKTAA